MRIVSGPGRGERKAHSIPSLKVMKMTQFRLPVFGLFDISDVHGWPRSFAAKERSTSRLNLAYAKMFSGMVVVVPCKAPWKSRTCRAQNVC